MKKRSERRKHCALAVVRRSQKFSPRGRPLPGGAGRPNINQLEMVTYLYIQTQFGEDRCTQFRVIVVTDPNTHKKTNPQTGTITIHCAAKLSAQCKNRTGLFAKIVVLGTQRYGCGVAMPPTPWIILQCMHVRLTASLGN